MFYDYFADTAFLLSSADIELSLPQSHNVPNNIVKILTFSSLLIKSFTPSIICRW